MKNSCAVELCLSTVTITFFICALQCAITPVTLNNASDYRTNRLYRTIGLMDEWTEVRVIGGLI